MTEKTTLGLAGRVARTFIDSKLTPLIVIASILLGAFAVVMLPREEEPQIKVPMVDVLVAMPGFSAKEVEERATRPMEKLLWEIPGVEYLYSTSKSGESLVIVRFKVGEDMERSLVKLNQKLQQNFDRIPHGVARAARQSAFLLTTCRSSRSPSTARVTIISRSAASSPRWTMR
jgi:multidrug efflux pump subunit AcrB